MKHLKIFKLIVKSQILGVMISSFALTAMENDKIVQGFPLENYKITVLKPIENSINFSESTVFLPQLPKPVLGMIGKSLSFKDLSKLCRVSKANHIFGLQLIWQKINSKVLTFDIDNQNLQLTDALNSLGTLRTIDRWKNTLVRLELTRYEYKDLDKMSQILNKHTDFIKDVHIQDISLKTFKKWNDMLKKDEFPIKNKTSFGVCFINVNGQNLSTVSEAIKENTSITCIDLYNSKIGDEGAKVLAEALKENKTLTVIWLDHNHIGSEGAKALAEALKENKTLTSIDLSYNNIGSEGAKAFAEALKENKTLTSIDLPYNNIGSEGAKVLVEALKMNTSIAYIDLSSNNIGSEGAEAFAEVLKDNKTLTRIYLKNNNIDSKGKKALSEIMKVNKLIKIFF